MHKPKHMWIEIASNALLEMNCSWQDESFQNMKSDKVDVFFTLKSASGGESTSEEWKVNIIYRPKEDRSIQMNRHNEVETGDEEEINDEDWREEICFNDE